MAGCSDCTSAQTYCQTNQQAKYWINNDDNFTLEYNELIQPEIWNNIKTILQEIYNFGVNGTRNPSQQNINDIFDSEKNQVIYLKLYNKIIEALQTGTNNININNGEKIDLYELISSSLIIKLQNYLNNYKLNGDRCKGCNTGCNTCDSCYAVCDGDCWQCWEGCGDCGNCEESCAMCPQSCTGSWYAPN